MTDGHGQDRAIEAAAREAAAAWVVRLASDAAVEADWLACEAWLAQSAAHRTAFDQAEALWRELDGLAAARPEWAPPPVRALPARPARPPRRAVIWGGALAASLALAAALWPMLQSRAPPLQQYATARGEQRRIALEDGTHIRLNSGSRLTVAFDRDARRATLAEGEAVFDVAKDRSRPFLVAAGDRTIRVVGTEFDVLNHAGRLEVSVRRGVVEVRRAGDGAPSGQAVRLHPGQQLVRAERGPDQVQAFSETAAFAWTEGRLVYRNARLDAVAADLNRYVPVPIVVSKEAAGVRVSAVLVLDEESAMLRRLCAFAPVSAVRDGGNIRLSLR